MDVEMGNPDFDKTLLSTHYMPRPRIEKILDYAVQGKLVYVVAGAGYGKTRAVRHYIEQQKDAVVRWVQLTESDNVGSRYWENLTHNISFDNPELAERLREFGFPDTLSRFKQFTQILYDTEHRSHKTYLVLDDFHLIHSKQALTFAERCAHLKIPGACVILISRTEPEINAVALFAKGQVNIITEDELRFTEDEISEFFKWRNIPLPPRSLAQIAEATKGWGLAVQLLSVVLAKNPQNFIIALDTMRQNIFKLMETEAWGDLSENIRKIMVKLSLISDLPFVTVLNHFTDSNLLQEAPQLTSFVWLDDLTGHSRVHPLYWEFLKTRQDILTFEEKQDTYQMAAQWCSDNRFYLDAVKYLAKAHQFERLVENLLTYPFKLPQDTCEYFLDILGNLDANDDERNTPAYLLLQNLFVPLLLSGAERYAQAKEICFEAIRQWENSDNPAASFILSIAYSNLCYLDMYTCTVTHKYDAPKYLKKSLEYSKRVAMPPMKTTGTFFNADIRSFACLVGEGADLAEFDIFIDVAKQTAGYVAAQTTHNMYYGYDELVAAELAFYKNRPEDAKIHANEAILKAREKSQHSIEAMAVMYLFRVAMQEGDYPQIRQLLRDGQNRSDNPSFWNRQFLYDLAIGFLYAQIGLPSKVPPWLITDDDKGTVLEVPIPARELICGARYYLAAKEYSLALTFLCRSYPRKPQERFLLGELTLCLLTAAARIRTGDAQGAVRDFEKAYSLSFDGVFEMPFIELGRDLHFLVTAVSERSDCGIPSKWLKVIDRKASAYAKKTAVILDSFKKEKNIEDSVKLSQREQEILVDLYHGLSREEIAVNRYLSINTVHKIIQSIFIKLNADNKADAIRIASTKNLLE